MTKLRGISGGAPDDEPEPWKDSSTFFKPGPNVQTVPTNFRMPESMSRHLSIIVQSRQVPGIQTNSDAIRDAMFRWLTWMAREIKDKKLAKELDIELRASRLEAMSKKRETLRSSIDLAARILKDESTDPQEKTDIIRELSELASDLHVESPFRTEIITLVSKYR